MEFFRPIVRDWFESTFTQATPVQRAGWPVLARSEHGLLLAPTGSGKTLAAFLWAIDRVSRLTEDAIPGVRILYLSPLKALVYDVERNLRAPLAGIRRFAARERSSLRDIRVDIRTGDTDSRERRRQLKHPADILVTTPESLYLILGSQAAQGLKSVHTVIVDEIHSLAGNKRGAHLALSLERLSAITTQEPQRIGLSATVHPASSVARFLGGDRNVSIVDASEPAHLTLSVEVPVVDMEAVPVNSLVPESVGATVDSPGPVLSSGVGERGADGERGETRTPKAAEPGSIWSMIYPALVQLIRTHQSTIVFVNSRSLAERLCQRLNDLADEPLVRAHHGSVSHQQRGEIEEALKAGRLRGIVATSSLELGIDMGAVDLVVLIESPGSVARGLQRVGRAGHSFGEKSRGRIFPKFRGDLLECAVVSQRMLAGQIESIDLQENPLDVLAQHIVAICSVETQRVDELERLVRRAAPYRALSRQALTAVLDMLSGQYAAQDFADLRPRLSWDRAKDELSARRGAKMIATLNAGTIPDRGLFGVYLGEDGPRIGELDEEMVYETRKGETFLLGASTWRVEAVTRDRVIVSPAPGEPGKMPFWHGDGPGRPLELGKAIGAFLRKLSPMSSTTARAWLLEQTPLDAFAAENLIRYVAEQKESTGLLPTDRNVVIEQFRDELGDVRICILTPFGARVHAPWALALSNLLSVRAGFEIETMYTDDGIVLRLPDGDELPPLDRLIPDPDGVEENVLEELSHSALFASVFRENAARALLLPRRAAGRRTPLWQQRLRAKNLMGAVKSYPSFPIVLETYRQCLKDVFDMPALVSVLKGIQNREISVHEVETETASPFARSLTFAYVAAYLYEQDAPLAERKAQALTLDRNLLRELLGQAELRELLDSDVLSQVEEELSRCADGYRARDADELEDLLRRLGDLSELEIEERSQGNSAESPTRQAWPNWLETLRSQRRAIRITLAGQARWIAASDAALYRDAFGVAPPAGLPSAFLEQSDAPLERLVRRFARTHGPFLTEDVSARWALSRNEVQPTLEALRAREILVRGEIRPGGVEPEWCDRDVLRLIKRRTLAKLRKAVAPVDSSVFPVFLREWHGLTERAEGRLEEVLSQLEGLAISFQALTENILPARVRGFQTDMLDLLSATGGLVWVGAGASGPRDGRIRLVRRELAAELIPAETDSIDPSEIEKNVLDHLAGRGASFTHEILQGMKDIGLVEIGAALDRLVWAGLVTNDTFAPLRKNTRSKSQRTTRVASRLGWGERAQRAGGRWSLVEDLRRSGVSPTERAHAQVLMLLERYGILSREAVVHEAIPGGFKLLYPVLKAMEERGQIRRGYFVEGLSGLQFALPAAVERLRSVRDRGRAGRQPVELLAAVDPANPYGALFPWPARKTESKRSPRRVSGAWVALHEGKLSAYLERGGRGLLTFEPFEDPRIARETLNALMSRPTRQKKSLRLDWIDEFRPTESPYVNLFKECGFFADYQSMVYAFNWAEKQ